MPEYLREFQAEEREMTKYIIGTVSELDTPYERRGEGSPLPQCLVHGIYGRRFPEGAGGDPGRRTGGDPPAGRDRGGDPDQNNLCVIGSKAAIEKHEDLFGTVENLTSA